MDLQTLWYLLAAVLVLVGLAGAVLPLLPGIPFVFGGLLLAAFANHFERVGAFTLTLLGALTVLSIALDFIAAALGAKRVKASPQAVTLATVGSIVGIFFGLFGLILGPFIGAVAGELMARGGLRQAANVGVATWIGLLIGIVAKLVLGLVMVGVFAFAWWV